MYCESRYATHHVTHHVIPPVPRLTLVTYGSCETVAGAGDQAVAGLQSLSSSRSRHQILPVTRIVHPAPACSAAGVTVSC